MTTEDNALIQVPEGEIAKWDKNAFDAVSSAKFLGRIQLMTSKSKQVEKGEFPANHYAYIHDQNMQDLGETVNLLCVTWRPKAMDMSDEQVINVFDPKSDEFQRIQNAAGQSDSMCMFGSEYLVWIAELKKFALFFMGTASSRRESPKMIERLQKAVTLDSKFIETKRYSWQTPVIKPCTASFELPTQEDLEREVNTFNNPPVQEVERVEEDSEERAR